MSTMMPFIVGSVIKSILAITMPLIKSGVRVQTRGDRLGLDLRAVNRLNCDLGDEQYEGG